MIAKGALVALVFLAVGSAKAQMPQFILKQDRLGSPVTDISPPCGETGCLVGGSCSWVSLDSAAVARELRGAAEAAKADASAANAAAGRLFALSDARRRDAEAYERAAKYLESGR
jgi:hypothetical protein